MLWILLTFAMAGCLDPLLTDAQLSQQVAAHADGQAGEVGQQPAETGQVAEVAGKGLTGPDPGPLDGHVPDIAPVETDAPDAGKSDTGLPDTALPDTAPPDTAPPDTGPPDTGPVDAGQPDAGQPDTGIPDSAPPDTAGKPDSTGKPDATAPPDLGQPDAGPAGPVCGNGVTESGETCDDRNSKSGDGCSATCQQEKPAPEGIVFIAKGKFKMGCVAPQDGSCIGTQETPHDVYLSAFFIDKVPVTADQYKNCVFPNGCTAPGTGAQATYGVAAKGNFPVHFVTWAQAGKYCSVKERRLCTESEWEFAARGTQSFKFPWGYANPTCSLANYAPCNGGKVHAVGLLPDGASPFSVLDMAGNIQQWTADWYGAYPTATTTDPKGPARGNSRVFRGGGAESGADSITCMARNILPFNGGQQHADIGFRCCKSL